MNRGRTALILALVVLAGAVAVLLFGQQPSQGRTTVAKPSIKEEVYREGLMLIVTLNTLELRAGDILRANAAILNLNNTANITFAALHGQMTLRVSDSHNETVYGAVMTAPGPTAPFPILKPGDKVGAVFRWNTSENVLGGDRPPSSGKYYAEVEGSVTDLDTRSKTMLRTSRMEVNLLTPPSVHDFWFAVEEVKRYSFSVRVVESRSGNRAVVDRSDSRFGELLQRLSNSIDVKVHPKTRVVVEDGQTITTTITIPYPWGYVLTFKLEDGSKIWFNCATESVWFETDQAIYQASIDPVIYAVIDEILG